MMTKRITTLFSLLGMMTAVAGCSNTASEMLTTGSLFGSKPKTNAQAPAPVVVKPTDRAIHVAAVSARAQKCGYYFDPAKLRTTYLASEAQIGLDAAQLDQITKVYDYTAGKIIKILASKEGYCTEERLGQIKGRLTRHLAGDFTPPKKKKQVAGSWFDFEPEDTSKQKLNPDWVNNPSQEPVTKPVEPE